MEFESVGEVFKGLPRLPAKGLWVNPREFTGKAHPHHPGWVSKGTHWSPTNGVFAERRNPNYEPRTKVK